MTQAIFGEEEYMGDGVYARLDGYQIWLRTARGDSNHEIALEPAVYEAVRAFGARIWSLRP